MSKKQKITLIAITAVFTLLGLTNGFGYAITFGAIAFGITYFFIQRSVKKANMTPEEKAEQARLKMEKQEIQRKKKIEKQAQRRKKQEQRQLALEAAKQAQIEANRPRCPYCKNTTNLQPLGQHKKGFSVGKAVGGAVLTGGVGALAGFAGKKTDQTDFVCMNCGKQFTR